MRVFLQSIYGQLFTAALFFWAIYPILPKNNRWRRLFILFFVVELSLYFFGFFLHQELPDAIMIPLMLICNTWYVASIYLSLGILLIGFIRLCGRLLPVDSKLRTSSNTTCLRWSYLLLFLCTVGLMIYGYHTATHPIVKEYHLHIPKKVDGKDTLTIALMSDTHFGEFIGKKTAQRFVRLSNAQHPDMVVIAGDIIDHEVYFASQQQIEKDLQQLEAPLGVYMVMGNHEYRGDVLENKDWLNQSGATLLIDSVVMIDNFCYIVGRDDAVNLKRKPLQAIVGGIDKKKPIILADHQPSSLNESMMNGVDLALHGHTHGGQIWPFKHLIQIKHKYIYGHYQQGQTQYIVTSGIGFAGFPYRIGSRSELAIIKITFDKSD